MNGLPPILAEVRDLNFEQIQSLLLSAKKLKMGVVPVGKYQLGENRQPIIATSFLEHSTRTKHSFAVAIQKLGAMYIDFNADFSSLKKGESLEETLLTLNHQGVDLCIMRTSNSHQFDEFRENPPIKMINGGDGINQHPTQALLDLMTFIEDGHKLSGATMAIIGDCIHSRVGHSLMELIPQFGAKIILCGPEECLPKQVSNSNIILTTDTDEAIRKSDFLYVLRIQKERHTGPAPYYHNYLETQGVSLERLKRLGRMLPVYHPGPCNIGVELDRAIVKSDYYRGYQQVVNSVYMRMAIIKGMLCKNTS